MTNIPNYENSHHYQYNTLRNLVKALRGGSIEQPDLDEMLDTILAASEKYRALDEQMKQLVDCELLSEADFQAKYPLLHSMEISKWQARSFIADRYSRGFL